MEDIEEHQLEGGERSREEEERKQSNDSQTIDGTNRTQSQNDTCVHHCLDRGILENHRMSKSNPYELYHCLRPPVQPLDRPPLASPSIASTRSTSDSMNAPFITRPLIQDPNGGIRSVLFTHQPTRLIIGTKDSITVWRMNAQIEGDASTSTNIHNDRDTLKSVGDDWTMEAYIDFDHLPFKLATDSDRSHCCPWRECTDNNLSALSVSPSFGSSSRHTCMGHSPSTSSAAFPVKLTPALVMKLSADESQLLIGVNRMLPNLPPSTPSSLPASQNLSQTSPSLSSLSGIPNSPAPSSSASLSRSPFSPTIAGTGSQGLEAELEAMLNRIDQDDATAKTATANGSTQSSTLDELTPSNYKSRSQSKKKKKTTNVEPTPITYTLQSAVFKLQLPPFASSSSLSSAPISSITTTTVSPPSFTHLPLPSHLTPSQSQSQSQSQPPLVGSQPDNMLDSMFAELMEEEEAADKSAKQKSDASSRSKCHHLQHLFTTSSPVTSLLSISPSVCLIGDQIGALTRWAASSTAQSVAWTIESAYLRSANAPTSAIKSLHIQHASSENSTDAIIIAVNESGDIMCWRMDRPDSPLRIISPIILNHPIAFPSVSASSPFHPPFIASPTTSTPSASGVSTPTRSVSAANGVTQPSDEMIVPETQMLATPTPIKPTPTHAIDSTSSPSLSASKLLVHSVKSIESPNGVVRLLFILSSEHSVNVPSGSSIPSPTSTLQSSASSRRSVRKSASTDSSYPPPPCQSQLTSMALVEFNLTELIHSSNNRSQETHLPVVSIRDFEIPLLLTGDNSSVHFTSSVATLSSSPSSHFSSSSPSSRPSPIIAGLSSGALVLYSPDESHRLMGFMSDATPNPTNQSTQSKSQSSCQLLNKASIFIATPNGAVAYEDTESNQLSSRRRRHISSTLTNSQTKSLTLLSATTRKRKSSPDPMQSIALKDGLSSNRAPSHVCTRAITDVALHSRWNLLAVGDEEGHVHVYASKEC